MSTPVSRLLLVMGMILFIGCSSPHSIMHSWVGQREYELYGRWGKPTKIIDHGTDGTIAVYMPGTSDQEDPKSQYCDYKFKTACIPKKTKQYSQVKLFYITPLGNIYASKIETQQKASDIILH